MKLFEFRGHSDDVFLLEGIDEFDALSKDAVIKLKDGDDQMLVIGRYFNDTWMIGVAQVSEDHPIPESWDIKIIQSGISYSPVLLVRCPESTIWEDTNEQSN